MNKELGRDAARQIQESKTRTGTQEQNTVNLEADSLLFENSKWLRTEETAEYLRTSPAQIRNWVYQGRLKAYKLFGRSLRFKKTELDLLLEGGGTRWE